jgi:hypothetical protein
MYWFITMKRRIDVIIWLAWSALSLRGIPTFAETVLWDRSDNEMVERGIEIPQTEFSRVPLIARCRAFLKDSTATVVHLTVTTPTRTVDFFQPSDSTYESWRMYYTGELMRPFFVAELVAINGNAVLRVHDGREVWRVTLTGQDPLVYSVLGASFEILYITKTPYKIVRPIRAYVRCTGAMTLENSNVLYQILQRLVRKQIHMNVRNDHWFYKSAFPPVYWYDSEAPPDQAEAVKAGPHIVCEERGEGAPPCVSVVR